MYQHVNCDDDLSDFFDGDGNDDSNDNGNDDNFLTDQEGQEERRSSRLPGVVIGIDQLANCYFC